MDLGTPKFQGAKCPPHVSLRNFWLHNWSMRTKRDSYTFTVFCSTQGFFYPPHKCCCPPHRPLVVWWYSKSNYDFSAFAKKYLVTQCFLFKFWSSSRGLDVWGFDGSAAPSWTETSDVVPRDCWSHDSSSCYQWDALILPSSCSLSHWEFLIISYPFYLMLLSAAIAQSITAAVFCSFAITAISDWLASSCLCIPQDSHPPQRCLPSQQIGSNPYQLL